MSGGYPPSRKPPPSYESHRKSRWESSTATPGNHHPSSSSSAKPPIPSSNNPNPHSSKRGNPNPSPSFNPIPPPGAPYSPQPPPSYGFHMLDRRTLVLADGSAHTYLALPPDYQDFIPPPPPRPSFPLSGPDLYQEPNGFRDQLVRNPIPNQDYWDSLGLDGRHGEVPLKRKFEGALQDDLARQRQHVLQYGNVGAVDAREAELIRASKAMRVGGAFDTVHHYETVDPSDLNKAFLKFARLLNENDNERKYFLENADHGPRHCIACNKRSKGIRDVHGLIMHSYNSDRADLRVDHLGLHKALCVLMGWNYTKPPDDSKAYQFLPADEASANQDDLIIWPPTVIIHNTTTGKGKDGRMEGVGNKTMDSIIKALGFPNGKSRALYNKEGHIGVVLIRFSADQPGLKEAIRLSEYFEKDNRGRRDWAQVQSTLQGKDDESNPKLVKVDARSREKKRIYYGHIFTASDLDKVDHETRKKAVLESKQEYLQPK